MRSFPPPFFSHVVFLLTAPQLMPRTIFYSNYWRAGRSGRFSPGDQIISNEHEKINANSINLHNGARTAEFPTPAFARETLTHERLSSHSIAANRIPFRLRSTIRQSLLFYCFQNKQIESQAEKERETRRQGQPISARAEACCCGREVRKKERRRPAKIQSNRTRRSDRKLILMLISRN